MTATICSSNTRPVMTATIRYPPHGACHVSKNMFLPHEACHESKNLFPATLGLSWQQQSAPSHTGSVMTATICCWSHKACQESAKRGMGPVMTATVCYPPDGAYQNDSTPSAEFV
ncbi:hypothetical protein RRG08_040982 [Elysia crispata]|uniref:Uncharacterized protein n=1 Tax=Elysia crispata TaxID=231223 RepID=A0AAE0ZIJ6_9GAST|nr:hypothetical protein RRG08_040982 [Elysia crispata]